MGFIFLGLSLILAFMVYRMGYRNGDWHWGGSLAAAAVPVLFTLVLGILGFVIGIGFVVAIWRATSL